MLFIEYDVDPEGYIELVALVNAIEAEGADDDGAAWLAWRRAEFADDGMGCVGVSPADLTLLEGTEDAAQLAAIVERIILGDRSRKEVIGS